MIFLILPTFLFLTDKKLNPLFFLFSVYVYLQNQIIRSEGALTLDTWTNGPVSLDNFSMTEPGGIDFGLIFSALKEVYYDGTLTVHQSAPEDGSSPMEVATQTSQYLRSLLSITGVS